MLAPVREMAEEEKEQQKAARAPRLAVRNLTSKVERLTKQEERIREQIAEAEASLVKLRADLAAKEVVAAAAKAELAEAQQRSAEDSVSKIANTAGIQAALQAVAVVPERFRGQACEVELTQMLAAVAAAAERLQLEDARLRKEQEARERAEKAKAQAAEGDSGAVGDDEDPDETMSCAGTDDAGDDVALATGIAQGYDGVLAKMLGQAKDEEAVKLRREIAAMCKAYGKQSRTAAAKGKPGGSAKAVLRK